MNKLSLDFKNDFDGCIHQSQKYSLRIADESIFNDFECLNCDLEIDERLLMAFSELNGSDDKLCCPFCFSLNVREVSV